MFSGNGPFGGLFDLNGDGKTDLSEEFMAYKFFTEMEKEEREIDFDFDDDFEDEFDDDEEE